MRLYKRGNIWWYELDFKRQQIRKSTKSKNRVVAGQIASAAHLALIKGEVGIVERKPPPNFKAAMAAFLAWSQIEHQSHPSTTERYQFSSKPLLAHFRDRPLDQITAEDADEYKQRRSRAKTRSGTQLRPATVNRELACLRAMFNHAMKSHPELRNPISKLTGVKLLAENNQQDRVLSFMEEERYLAHARPNLLDVATIILQLGMRPEEVFTLRASQVDLERNQLRILKSKTPAGKRRLDLSPAAHTILEKRIAARPVGYLFPNSDDETLPLPGLQSAHEYALLKSKVPKFRIYDLRHTFATRAVEGGMDLVTLAAVLGHSRIQMVLRYAHPTQGHQATAMEKARAHSEEQRAIERRRSEEAQRQHGPGLHLVKRSA